MTKRQFVVLAFRLFALYLVFTMLPSIGYFFNFLNFPGGGGLGIILSSAFAICLSLFFISLLWRKSEWLMQKMFNTPALSDPLPEYDKAQIKPHEASEEISENAEAFEEEPMDTPMSIKSIELVAFSMIGIWAVITAIPNLVRAISLAWSSPASLSLSSPSITVLLPHLVQMALGLWLFLRPWQFQGWIQKFKPKAPSADEIAN